MTVSGGDVPNEVTIVSPVVGAAHELKAPLSLIRQLALRLDDTGVTSEQQRLVHQLTLTTERALRLTTDMTKAARLQDAMFALEPLNPEQVCRDIIHELTPLFEAHGRQIAFGKARRLQSLLLVGNRDLLRRILTNFSDNALHYTDVGSIVQLQVTALKKSGRVRIGVRDFGPALSPDMWKTLRRRIGVSAQSVSARPQSSGLGLYLAGQFAEAMDAEIGVTRHRDGATFYVDLQASQQMSLL
jgi:two-component system sensor histidine kinase SaeS